jgi:hypothetical protein
LLKCLHAPPPPPPSRPPGSLPASLGALPSLVHVNLRSNVLGGELKPFAQSLMDGSERIVYLDLSDNYFEGPIPQEFEQTNILNTASNVVLNGCAGEERGWAEWGASVWAALWRAPAPCAHLPLRRPLPHRCCCPCPRPPRRRVPAQRVFDLSNNSFSGAAFPMWLVERVFTERDDCNCPISVAGAPRAGAWAAPGLARQPAPRPPHLQSCQPLSPACALTLTDTLSPCSPAPQSTARTTTLRAPPRRRRRHTSRCLIAPTRAKS